MSTFLAQGGKVARAAGAHLPGLLLRAGRSATLSRVPGGGRGQQGGAAVVRSPWLGVLTPLARPDLEPAASGGAGRGGAGTAGGGRRRRSSARAAVSMRSGTAR